VTSFPINRNSQKKLKEKPSSQGIQLEGLEKQGQYGISAKQMICDECGREKSVSTGWQQLKPHIKHDVPENFTQMSSNVYKY
jgi:hypothetical protein